VQRWCARQVSHHLCSEIRVEYDIAPRHLTIVECRTPRQEDQGAEWTWSPIVRCTTPRPPVSGRCTAVIGT
jgi:hypothetical protein